jgi:F-type H+-transporting ATPase subunit beta
MSEPPTRERTDVGQVLTIRGSVVDARFPRQLPAINHQLAAGPEGSIVIEVVTHLSSEIARGIALTPTQGLARGSPVIDLGHHLKVPVGKRLLGRMFRASTSFAASAKDAGRGKNSTGPWPKPGSWTAPSWSSAR